MNMRPSMIDVIDGSRAYFEGLVGFNGATAFDVRANLSRFEFVVNQKMIEVQQYPPYIKIDQDNRIYYAFITDYKVVNDHTTLITFQIDWWHTTFIDATLPTLSRAWIRRSNKHTVEPTFIKNNSKTVYRVTVGEGQENVNPLQLPVLWRKQQQGCCVQNLTTTVQSDAEFTTDLDGRLMFVRIVSTKGKSFGTIPALSPFVSKLYNNLYVGYLMFCVTPDGVDPASYVVHGCRSDGTIVNEIYKTGAGAIINNSTAHLSQWATDPNTVSIDIVGYMPVIKSIEKKTVDGVVNYYINFIESDNSKTIYILPNTLPESPSDYGTTFTWFGELPEPAFYTTLPFELLNEWGALTTVDTYSHAGHTTHNSFEPKLAQLQYSKLRLTNYKSDGVRITGANALTIVTGLKTKTHIAQSYNEPNSQCAYSVYGADEGVMLTPDSVGSAKSLREHCVIDTSLNELPVIGDEYLTYMQNKRNSFETGYALQTAQLALQHQVNLSSAIANLGTSTINLGMRASEGFVDHDYTNTFGALGNFVNSGLKLGATIESDKLKREALQQTHNAFIEDMKASVRSVNGGSNAVFNVDRGDLWLTWELWRPTLKDRERLIKYFKYNGYSVNEQQTDISLDNMYYFDYIEADNVAFPAGVEIDTLAMQAILDKLSNGMRIWHQRGNAFMTTPLNNTAKEF